LTRFSDSAKELKNSVKKFVETNVDFIGEFPSCIATNKSANTTSSSERYLSHIENNDVEEHKAFSLLQDSIVHVQKWLQTTYDLLRTVASEILVFMLNDLDRIYSMEISNAHPVAYALKGPSMPTDVLRRMMKELIEKCENKGLNILVTASDGQWHLYGVRENTSRALTVHQLQKDHWKDVNSRSKPVLQSNIKEHFNVDKLSLLHSEVQNGKLVIYKKDTVIPVYIKDKWDLVGEPTDEIPVVEQNVVQGCFNGEFENEVQDDLMQEVDDVFTDLTSREHDDPQKVLDSTYEDANWFYNTDCDPSATVPNEGVRIDSFYTSGQASGSYSLDLDLQDRTYFDQTHETEHDSASNFSNLLTDAFNVL
jgi:hypothetical protein